MTRRPAAPLVRRAPGAPAAAPAPSTADQREDRPPLPSAAAGRRARRRPARAGRATPGRRRGRWDTAVRAVRTRTSSRRSALVLAAVAVLLALAAWALLVSPLTALREVAVTGARRTDPAAVRAAADGQLGRPLLRVDAGALRRGTAGLPFVRGIAVHRHLWHRVVLVVTERVPVAAVPRPGSGGAGPFDVLEASGAVIDTEPTAPAGVPVVDVDVATAGAPALRAASTVARALPADLRADVQDVTATSPDDVRLALRGGEQVRWGGTDAPAFKARVLAVLRSRPGSGPEVRPRAPAGSPAGSPRARTYDVSAPAAPATS